MSLKKLFLILSIIAVINFLGVYIVFYFNPVYSIIKGNVGGHQLGWGSDSSEIIYLSKEDDKAFVNVLNIESEDSESANLGKYEKIGFADIISLSPSGDKVVYFYYENDTKKIGIYDLNNKKRIIFKNNNLSFTESGRVITHFDWLDNNTIIYENSVPFEHNGVIILNIVTNKELYLNNARKPVLSNDKSKLAYVMSQAGGGKFDIFILDLETEKSTKYVEGIDYYCDYISWSPSDKYLAVGFKENTKDPGESSDRIGIVYGEADFRLMSSLRQSKMPEWIDDDNLLVLDLDPSFVFKGVSTYNGLYMYNLKTRNYKKITSKIRSAYYAVSPNRKTVISSLHKNGIFVLDLKRVIEPSYIDRMRDKFGITGL